MTTVYPELLGYRHRDNEIPPVKIPDHCPICKAKLSNHGGRLSENDVAVYDCGGSYRRKRQIQCHTFIWCGTCPKAKEVNAADELAALRDLNVWARRNVAIRSRSPKALIEILDRIALARGDVPCRPGSSYGEKQ